MAAFPCRRSKSSHCSSIAAEISPAQFAAEALQNHPVQDHAGRPFDSSAGGKKPRRPF
jgi:hypothetical protein